MDRPLATAGKVLGAAAGITALAASGGRQLPFSLLWPWLQMWQILLIKPIDLVIPIQV
jgi:hypothetical protein